MSSNWAHSPRPYRAITGLYSYIPIPTYFHNTVCGGMCTGPGYSAG